MKIRTDYVSNSSSSSFIVIAHDGETNDLDRFKNTHKTKNYWDTYEFPSRSADYEFGWENCQYAGVMTKLNFIGIQLLELMAQRLNNAISTEDKSRQSAYLSRLDEYVDRVERVLANLGINAELSSDCLKYNWKYKDFSVKGVYIDHQSSVTENMNMEMLETDDALTDFLTYDGSYIQGGNDNE